MEYSEFPGLSDVYLEDSYVLGIAELPDRLEYDMEFVLTPQHPLYHEPRNNEQHCYERGQLTFGGVSKLEWLDRARQVFTDATGEVDFGNIDFLTREHDHWRAGGSWGEVLVFTAATPKVSIKD